MKSALKSRKRKIGYLLISLLAVVLGAAVAGCTNGDPQPSDIEREWVVARNAEGNITIMGYNGAPENGTLTVPAELTVQGEAQPQALKVTKIAPRAFFNSEIKHVVIPQTVTSIGVSAFENSEQLETVVFEQNSELKEIGKYAFNDCESLYRFNTGAGSTVTIPENVERIGEMAFGGVKKINRVDIPAKTTDLEERTFANMGGVQVFNVNSQNAYYTSEKGNIYSRYGELVQYAIGGEDTGFVMPHYVAGVAVTRIGRYAFYKATRLTTVSLSNVVTIDEYAFADCSRLMYLIDDDQVSYVAKNAFEGTVLTANHGDFWMVGTVLYRYVGTAKVISDDMFPSSVERIGECAFKDNESVEEIYLPMSLLSIGAHAFRGCSRLVKLQLQNFRLPVMWPEALEGLSKNFTFYCAKTLQEEMLASKIWEFVHIQPIVTQAYFADIDETFTFFYGETVSLPPKKVCIGANGKEMILSWREVLDEGGTLSDEALLADSFWNRTEERLVFKAQTSPLNHFYLLFINGDKAVGGCYISSGVSYRFDQYGCCIDGIQEPFLADSMNASSDGEHTEFLGWYIDDTLYSQGVWGNDDFESDSLCLVAKWG